jgi:hypothetical protein
MPRQRGGYGRGNGGFGKKSEQSEQAEQPKQISVLRNPQTNKLNVWKPVNQECWNTCPTSSQVNPNSLRVEILFQHTIFGSPKSEKFMVFGGFGGFGSFGIIS